MDVYTSLGDHQWHCIDHLNMAQFDLACSLPFSLSIIQVCGAIINNVVVTQTELVREADDWILTGLEVIGFGIMEFNQNGIRIKKARHDIISY